MFTIFHHLTSCIHARLTTNVADGRPFDARNSKLVIHITLPNIDVYIYYFVKLSFKIVTNNIR